MLYNLYYKNHVYKNLKMNDIVVNINKIALNDFGIINWNCSNNIIYNLMNRPTYCNSFVKEFFKVEKTL